MHFWRLTPDEYRGLTVAEHAAMCRYMQRYSEAVKRGV